MDKRREQCGRNGQGILWIGYIILSTYKLIIILSPEEGCSWLPSTKIKTLKVFKANENKSNTSGAPENSAPDRNIHRAGGIEHTRLRCNAKSTSTGSAELENIRSPDRHRRKTTQQPVTIELVGARTNNRITDDRYHLCGLVRDYGFLVRARHDCSP